MKFELHYIAKPYKQHQGWGVYNKAYKKFGFTLHNGEDISQGKDKLIYCPIPCEYYATLWQPDGGGLVLSLLTDEYYWLDGQKAKVLIDLLHLKEVKVEKRKRRFEIGEVLAVSDNTGFSTGPHTHIQCRRVIERNGLLYDVDKNEANNSFDHTRYYNGVYAEDYKVEVPVEVPIEIQKTWLEVLKSYVNVLLGFIKLK